MTFLRAISCPATASAKEDLSGRSFTKADAQCVARIFCGMKIAEDVRRYAAQEGVDENAVIDHGLQKRAREFQQTGAEVYAKL